MDGSQRINFAHDSPARIHREVFGNYVNPNSINLAGHFSFFNSFEVPFAALWNKGLN